MNQSWLRVLFGLFMVCGFLTSVGCNSEPAATPPASPAETPSTTTPAEAPTTTTPPANTPASAVK
ncbi:MAG: hypothetical protein ACM35G_06375 [Planctomycetaceae bacterium]